MSDSDLDKYLEGLGITVDEEDEPTEFEALLGEEPEYDNPVGLGGPIVQGSPAERAETFLVNVLLNLDPAYAVEVKLGAEGEIEAEVFGGDPGKIIGRNGRTLAALEYLTNAVVNRDDEERVRVNIDVGGYKHRRDERLRNEAFAAAARVRKTGVAVEMEAMPAAERRVVHMSLAEEADVRTESRGDGADRRVVVRPT